MARKIQQQVASRKEPARQNTAHLDDDRFDELSDAALHQEAGEVLALQGRSRDSGIQGEEYFRYD